MDLNHARAITRCFEAADSAGAMADSLLDTLVALLSEQLAVEGSRMDCAIKNDGRSSGDSRDGGSGWVYSDTARSIPLGRASKQVKRPKAFIVLQVSFYGAGVPARLGEPLLHIGLWEYPLRFSGDDETWMFFPAEDLPDPFEKEASLLTWTPPEWEKENFPWGRKSWVYSVRLTCLEKERDLRDLVLRPVMSLLSGNSTEAALPSNLLKRGLVKYRWSDLVEGGAED